MMLPDDFTQKMQKLLGDDYDDYLASFNQPTYHGIRMNTLKWEGDKETLEQFDCAPVPWCNVGYYYAGDTQPAKDWRYHAGLYYIQEPSAMAPASFLDVQPGDKVLDLCAAPGGKSTHLGAKLSGDGLLLSNDISVSRTKALLKNIELFAITNAIVTAEKPEKLAKKFPLYFDKILVDAPCSGEGMFRKDHNLIKSYEKNGVEYYSQIQRSILPQAVDMLKPGGLLLYSTCTFSPEENEGAIQYLLDQYEELELLPLPSIEGLDTGHPLWTRDGALELSCTRRLWPHKIKGEGHYVALLRKVDNAHRHSEKVEASVPLKKLESFVDFCKENLVSIPEGSFSIFHDGVYVLPNDMPDLKGIRVVRQGWYLGEMKKNRFEPSQAMAMGLKKDEVKHTISMCKDDPRVIKYLKGETIEWEEAYNGWVLVCVDDFPLGWGKQQKTKIKNKLSKTWRWQ